MKKLPEKEINALFKKIIPNEWFTYFQEINQLKLDGTFSPDQLMKLASLMNDLSAKEDEAKRIKKVKVGKFTAKDIKERRFNNK